MLRKTFSSFFSYPTHFLLLQLPATSVEMISDVFLPEGDWKIVFGLLILFPYLCITSTLSTSLTFASIRMLENGERVSFIKSWAIVSGKLKSLIPVSMTTGLVMILGLLTVFVMLFHYLALYLFVPILLVTEPELPWTVYLHRSKLLVKGAYGKATLFVIVMLFTSFLGDGSVAFIDMIFPIENSIAGSWVLGFVKYFVSLFCSSLLSIGLAYFFLRQKYSLTTK